MSTHWSSWSALERALYGVVVSFGLVAAASANPLVGQWAPAPKQPSEVAAGLVEQLGQMQITPTHLSAFGEKPVTYSYHNDGASYSVIVDEPNAKPVEFILQDSDTLLTRFPNNLDILWKRTDGGGSDVPAPGTASSAQSAKSPAEDLTSGVIAMAMPHSQLTRYEAVQGSLEVLLNDGWTIAQASGAGSAMGLILKKDHMHIVCLLMGNLQGTSGGRSDCRRLN